MKNSFQIKFVLVLKSFFILCVLFISTSRGVINEEIEIKDEWVDIGCAALPVPLYIPSSIALRHVNISATFTEDGKIAHINSSYIFDNNGTSNETAYIMFPFGCTPNNFEIYSINKSVDYLWVSDQNISIPAPYDTYKFNAYQVNLTLTGNETKIIQIEYDRAHLRERFTPNSFICTFGYIHATSLLWKPIVRPFEFVTMDFWVPSHSFDTTSNDSLPRRIMGDYTVFTYLNTDPTDLLWCMFVWISIDLEELLDEVPFGYSFIIAICILPFVFRKKRPRKKSKKEEQV